MALYGRFHREVSTTPALDLTKENPGYLTLDLSGLASVFDARGDLLVGTGPDAPDRLAVGTDGQMLYADSAQPGGLRWDDPPAVAARFQLSEVALLVRAEPGRPGLAYRPGGHGRCRARINRAGSPMVEFGEFSGT